jgi:sensor histidine kinase YesM
MPLAHAAVPHLLHRVSATLVLCVAVSVFLAVGFDRWWPRDLLYSLLIGLSCHVFIDGGRLLAARLLDRFAPRNPPREGWPGWPAMAAIVALGALAGLTLGFALGDALTGARSVHAMSGGRHLALMILIPLGASAVATLYYYSREHVARSESQAQAAQRAAAEAQLKLIESQLEPHMLFNTLANLRALIGVDPPRAQAMLDRLISFLRATLGASRTPLHPLAAEFDRIADYFALMAVRMGPRLQTRLELPAALRDVPVPPLLLQPLVENSIKHGLEPQVAGGTVVVSAERRGDTIVLAVYDSGAGLRAGTDGTRFGLQQVRERLAAVYGERASLALDAMPGGGTLARITLPPAP